MRLRVLLDASVVSVFAGQGQTVLTRQIFPGPGSTGMSLYAEGGRARLVSLVVYPLSPIWP